MQREKNERNKASTAGCATCEQEELQVLKEPSLGLPSYSSELVGFQFLSFLFYNENHLFGPCLCEVFFFQH